MLTEQLQKQIEQEARQFAMHNYINMAVHKNVVEDDIETWPEYARVCYHSILNYMTGKEICWPFSDKSLAMQWQQAQQLIERYENALKQIEQMSDPGDYWKAICHMKAIASEALTPKTGSDE